MPEAPESMGSVTSCHDAPPFVLTNTPASLAPATITLLTTVSNATRLGCQELPKPVKSVGARLAFMGNAPPPFIMASSAGIPAQLAPPLVDMYMFAVAEVSPDTMRWLASFGSTATIPIPPPLGGGATRVHVPQELVPTNRQSWPKVLALLHSCVCT